MVQKTYRRMCCNLVSLMFVCRFILKDISKAENLCTGCDLQLVVDEIILVPQYVVKHFDDTNNLFVVSILGERDIFWDSVKPH